MSERIQKNLIVGLGALMVAFALGAGLHLDPVMEGALAGGLFWLNCH